MPALADILVAALLVCSGVVVLVAALGLWRLPDFFLRMHAPALASTLAAWAVTLASIVHFSHLGQGLALHAWLIIIVLSIITHLVFVKLAKSNNKTPPSSVFHIARKRANKHQGILHV